MIDFDLGETTEWDISLDDTQDIALIEGAAETGQACGILFKAHEREYFKDQDFGPDHANKVLTKPFVKESARQHYASKLRGVEGVRSIEDIALTPSPDRDTPVQADISIQSIYGPASISI